MHQIRILQSENTLERHTKMAAWIREVKLGSLDSDFYVTQ
jgi:hypothetical protein